MRNKKIKIWCFLFAVVFVCNSISHLAEAASISTLLQRKDRVVLTVGIGSEIGKLGYSNTFEGGGEGPETFTVTEDGTIYIVDNVNKRVNIYKNNCFVLEIPTPYISYVRSIEVTHEKIYLMDYDAGKIYIINFNGSIEQSITLPDEMEPYLMDGLYLHNDGSVWLNYVNFDETEECNNSITSSYLVTDLADGKMRSIDGFTKNGNILYNVMLKSDREGAVKAESNNTYGMLDEIKVSAIENLAEMRLLNVDNNNTVFISAFDMINTSIVAGEYTVRKYLNGKCSGITSIDLENYYYIPYDMLSVTETGILYQMICYDDKVQIVQKRFIDEDKFESKIDLIRTKTLMLEQNVNESHASRTVINAPNDRETTIQISEECCMLSWTYSEKNTKNPDASNITIPDYLTYASIPSTQQGIPYCWGGFDGINTSSSPKWTNFLDAIDKGAFAGNVNINNYYKQGTAGLDCSGYVSSAAGFSNKLGTADLASSTYTTEIEESDRQEGDIYVKAKEHVAFFVKGNPVVIVVREATTKGTNKTKQYMHSVTEFTGYSLRTFNGW